jgi:hypothetical protein
MQSSAEVEGLMDKIKKLMLHWKKKSREMNRKLEGEIVAVNASLNKL